jgi:Arc/MetJ-type ribon-helix-helix transcriptional regulator
MSSPALYHQRLSVSVTDKMNDLLEDMASARTKKGKPINKSDLIREAVRLFLDEQADARGSRKQIAKSLEGQLEQLTAELHGLQQQVAALTQQLEAQGEFLLKLSKALSPLIEMAAARAKQAWRLRFGSQAAGHRQCQIPVS